MLSSFGQKPGLLCNARINVNTSYQTKQAKKLIYNNKPQVVFLYKLDVICVTNIQIYMWLYI